MTMRRLVEKGGGGLTLAFFFEDKGWLVRLAIGGYLVKFGGPVRYLRMPVPRFLILATVFFFFKSITL